MTTLIGRDSELRQIQRYLDRAKSEPVAGSICLRGQSGIGKSAIMEVAAVGASDSGWLVASVTCHRIQAGLPFTVARRIFQTLLKVLGDDAARYTSGLGDVENPELETALPALLEGIAFDKPVLLAIDDIQWIDAETSDLIETFTRQLADKPIVELVTAQQSDVAPSEGFQAETTIAVVDLSTADARKVVESIFTGANASIVLEILGHAAGNTVDLIALAEAAQECDATTATDVSTSMRNVMAKRVKALDRCERELLQLCSIMPDPIEYALLSQLFHDEQQLTTILERVSGRYLVRRGASLAFTHRAIATAVRETIPVEIPLRRRVIAALESLPFPTTEHRFHVAEQALACEDRTLAHQHFRKIARDGSIQNQPRVVIEASQAALEIGAPPAESHIRFYADYAKALQVTGQSSSMVDLLERGIREATRIEGARTAELVFMLIIAHCFTDNMATAKSTYAQYSRITTDPQEAAYIETGALWFSVCEADGERLRAAREKIEATGDLIEPEIRLRLQISTAYVAQRCGDYAGALAALDQAKHEVRAVNSPVRVILDATSAYVDFLQNGPSTIERRAAEFDRIFSPTGAMGSFFMYTQLVTGKWVEAESLFSDALNRSLTRVDRVRWLSLIAMISALREIESPYDTEINHEAEAFAKGASGVFYIPLAGWWSARVAKTQPELARRIFERALARCATPMEPQCFLPLVGLALAAKRMGKPRLEYFVAHPPWVDQAPVNQAQMTLAFAIVHDALGSRDTQEYDRAIRACESLDLRLYTLIGKSLALPQDPSFTSELAKLGVHLELSTQREKRDERSPQKLTARERHVASIVAEGLTNRDIAERLVLSERTIEAHVANIFNKLNVSSRTQVAAWYLRSTVAG